MNVKELMTPEEIAKKYVFGNHDSLTDNQEIKDMAADIRAYAEEYAQSKEVTEKRKIYSLTDEECLHIAELVTDGVAENISRIDRSKVTNRVEIFCNDTTEKIDINGYNWISWKERNENGWVCLGIENYKQLFEYLKSINVI